MQFSRQNIIRLCNKGPREPREPQKGTANTRSYLTGIYRHSNFRSRSCLHPSCKYIFTVVRYSSWTKILCIPCCVFLPAFFQGNVNQGKNIKNIFVEFEQVGSIISELMMKYTDALRVSEISLQRKLERERRRTQK